MERRMVWIGIIVFWVGGKTLVGDEYEELCDYLQQVKQDHPSIVKIDTLGESVEGRKILGVKISDNPEIDEIEPEVLIEGGTHGNERKSYQLIAPYFINFLTDNYETNEEIKNLVDSTEIWFIPMINPDGAVKGFSGDRENANGVDLNRDYGYMWKKGSSGFPFSQPETRVVREFFRKHPFVVAISHHAGKDCIGYPWSVISSPSCGVANLDSMAKTYAQTANPTYDYGQAFTVIYTASGTSKDFYHGTRGVISWSLEVGSQIISNLFERNKPALIALLKKVHQGIRGKVVDKSTKTPVEAVIKVGNFQPVYSSKTNGDYYKFVTPGTYSVKVWANGYETKTIENVVIPSSGYKKLDVELEKREKFFAQEIVSVKITDMTGGRELYTKEFVGENDGKGFGLGRKGWVILDMGVNIKEREGKEIVIYEGSEDNESERVKVYVNIQGIDTMGWKEIGEGSGGDSFDISGSGYSSVRYVKVVDVSEGGGDSPGFELDAIEGVGREIKDIGIVEVIGLEEGIIKDSTYIIKTIVKNFGSQVVSCKVSLRIEVEKEVVVEDTVEVVNLGEEESREVEFKEITVQQLGEYIACVRVHWGEDSNLENNEVCKSGEVTISPISVTIGEKKGEPGETVEIPIVVEQDIGGLGIISCDIKLKVDTEVVKCIKVEKGEIVKEGWSFDFNVVDEKIIIGMYGSDELEGKGSLGVCHFKIKEETEEGDSSNVEVISFEFNEGKIPTKVKEGKVKVGKIGIEEVIGKEVKVKSKQVDDKIEIYYKIEIPGEVWIKVYDTKGAIEKEVRGVKGKGAYIFIYSPSRSGVYFWKITKGEESQVRKIVVIK